LLLVSVFQRVEIRKFFRSTYAITHAPITLSGPLYLSLILSRWNQRLRGCPIPVFPGMIQGENFITGRPLPPTDCLSSAHVQRSFSPPRACPSTAVFPPPREFPFPDFGDKVLAFFCSAGFDPGFSGSSSETHDYIYFPLLLWWETSPPCSSFPLPTQDKSPASANSVIPRSPSLRFFEPAPNHVRFCFQFKLQSSFDLS